MKREAPRKPVKSQLVFDPEPLPSGARIAMPLMPGMFEIRFDDRIAFTRDPLKLN